MSGPVVLLTGATGFVGRPVLERLLARGYPVVAVAGHGGPGDARPNLDWRTLDMLAADTSAYAALIDDHEVTHCLHTAWYTSHLDYLVADINRQWAAATSRLMDACQASGVRRFVGLGTCIEYDATADDGLFCETTTPLAPDTLYGRCKVDAFRSLEARVRDDDWSAAWARLFFIYGPGDRPTRLIPYIIDSLARGQPARARNGGVLRDYIHVDDLARQLVRILFSDVRGAVNTGTGAAPRLADIFAELGRLFGRPDLVAAGDGIGDQPLRIQADLTRFRAELGDPKARTIQQGLAELHVEACR